MTQALNILVFGQNGQLARALARLCQDQNVTAEFIGSKDADLAANPRLAYDIIYASSANIVINAAAYTQVDNAETDVKTAMALNSRAPGIMARACAELGKGFIHISTDYVFDGQASSPYKTNDLCNPVNAYGETKHQGELSVHLNGAPLSSIIRTSWVYDGVSQNFLSTMLRLAETRDGITVVHDQIGRPTFAGDLAKACLNIAASLHNGIDVDDVYHVTNSGDPISWADFARAIFKTAHINCRVKDIPTSDYPTPAKRPAYSVLDISRYENHFGLLPPWQDGLERALSERKT